MLLWPFNKYPGTDYETFNWEWVLKTVKEWVATMQTFKNTITSAWEAMEAEWQEFVTSTYKEQVTEILEDHPDWTTTVQNGSITRQKFAADVTNELDDMTIDAAQAKQKSLIAELFDSRYVGHKSFSGWISGTTSKPVAPSNSLMALDLAKNAGIKFVETDTTILSDGTWVISHEMDTSEMSGELANLIDIDLANFRSRTVIREYLISGAYWNYDASLQYKPLTLREYLLRAKELGLYVMPEVKWLDEGFTAENWEDFADIVKECGMESNIIIYTPYSAYMDGMKANLPNTPVCYSGMTSATADTQLEHIASYPYALACTGETDYSTTLAKCLDAGIPLGLWIVDDYDKAKKFIKDGGAFIITNCLTESIESDRFELWNEFEADEFHNRAKNYVNTGSIAYTDGVFNITSDTYAQTYLQAVPCEPGDIIVMYADVKSDGNAEGQLVINNTLAEPARRRVVSSSKATEWQTLTAVFLCGESDSTVNIMLSNRTSIAGSLAQFKNVVVKHYRMNEPVTWTELTNIAFAKKGKTVTITKKASVSIPATTWTKIDELPFPLYPTRDLEFPILANGSGSVTGVMRVDHYGDVKLYCSAASTGQYFTVTYEAI